MISRPPSDPLPQGVAWRTGHSVPRPYLCPVFRDAVLGASTVRAQPRTGAESFGCAQGSDKDVRCEASAGARACSEPWLSAQLRTSTTRTTMPDESLPVYYPHPDNPILDTVSVDIAKNWGLFLSKAAAEFPALSEVEKTAVSLYRVRFSSPKT